MPAPDVTSTTAMCHGVTVEHHTASGVIQALRDVSATFEPARLTVVAGPSGSGKSSLLRVLAGLHAPEAGTVVVGGHDLGRLRPRARRRLRRRRIGVVLQSPADNLIEYLRAIEQVELAARLRGSDPAEAAALLERVGLADRADHHPADLSGGEQQRVAFAAAVVGRPALLVADEPTAQLDAASGARLIDAVHQLVERGTTAVLASHDDAVIAVAHHVIELHDGEVVAQ